MRCWRRAGVIEELVWGGDLLVAKLQDAVDMELDRINPCLLTREGCQGQVLLLWALSLRSSTLVPASAFAFLNSM